MWTATARRTACSGRPSGVERSEGGSKRSFGTGTFSERIAPRSPVRAQVSQGDPGAKPPLFPDAEPLIRRILQHHDAGDSLGSGLSAVVERDNVVGNEGPLNGPEVAVDVYQLPFARTAEVVKVPFGLDQSGSRPVEIQDDVLVLLVMHH